MATAGQQTIDTTTYKQPEILLPGERGYEFPTVGTTWQPPRIIVEHDKDTNDYIYSLLFIDETGEKQCYLLTSKRPLLVKRSEEIFEGGIVYEKQPGRKCNIFQEGSIHGRRDNYMNEEGCKVLEPAPEHQGKRISIKTCFTDSDFGARHMVQRIFFFVDGVQYPFATLQLCCTHSLF